MLRQLASKLPLAAQTALKKQRFRWQILRHSFVSPEPEFNHLRDWIKEGDWVIDGGANIGYYTLEMSRLAGASGRVLAFEPMPLTFELLACDCGVTGRQNVTLFNAALSCESSVVAMELPVFETGTANYFQARIGGSGLNVLALGLDSLKLPQRVSLIKLDLEGHEAHAVKGMLRLLERDKPRMIIEGRDESVARMLSRLGYRSEYLPASPNLVWSVS